MTDSSGSRLLIRSNATGAENAFRTTVTDDDGGNADAAGLSALAFDPSAGGAAMTQSQTAADAAALVNGLPVTSTSNTLTNIVDGLTLTLNAETTLTGPATVNVVTDTEALKKTLTDFAAAYSALVKLIAADTKYDPVAKKGAILQGDSAATGMQRQLRTLAGSASAASAVFGHLSDIGLELQADGSMTVNASRLGAALANVAELKKMFSNSSLADPTLDGFGKRFRAIADSMIGIDGALTTRTDGLGQQLQRNQKDQDALEIRLAAIEKRYRAQYTALDTAMAQLQTQSSYITQQIAAWSANAKDLSGAAPAAQRRGEGLFTRPNRRLRGFKSAGPVPILTASPHREDPAAHVRPRPFVAQRLQRLRRRLPHGRRRDRRRRRLAAPARDHAVRRLQRRDRRGPGAPWRRARSRPSARPWAGRCGSSTRASRRRSTPPAAA